MEISRVVFQRSAIWARDQLSNYRRVAVSMFPPTFEQSLEFLVGQFPSSSNGETITALGGAM